MSAIFYKLKNFFPFRNRTNFLVSFLACTGTSYFVFRYGNDQKFSHPVIAESLRLLMLNKQIVEMVGYPITIVPGIVRNHATYTETANVYQFVVRGPRGTLNISLQAESKPQKDIKNDNISKEFYIPDYSLKYMIDDVKIKEGEAALEKAVIPEDKKFWKIDFLIVDISADYRIPIIKPKEQVTNKIAIATDPVDEPKGRRYLMDIYKEEAERTGKDLNIPRTEEEIEEIRRFKMNETYRKVGYVRTYLMMVAIFGTMGAYIYIIKNKRLKIQGSEIQYLMQQMVMNHSYIRGKYGNNLKFIQTSRGSIVDKSAEFEQDFMASKGFATVITKGVYDDRKNKWNISSIQVGSKNKKGEISDLYKLL